MWNKIVVYYDVRWRCDSKSLTWILCWKADGQPCRRRGRHFQSATLLLSAGWSICNAETFTCDTGWPHRHRAQLHCIGVASLQFSVYQQTQLCVMYVIWTIFDRFARITETFYLQKSCVPSSNLSLQTAQTPTTRDLQPKLSELLKRLQLKTSAPSIVEKSSDNPIFGNLATGYMEYYRDAKLEGKMPLCFWATNKNGLKNK